MIEDLKQIYGKVRLEDFFYSRNTKAVVIKPCFNNNVLSKLKPKEESGTFCKGNVSLIFNDLGIDLI